MSTSNTDIKILPVRPAVGLAVVSLIAGILAFVTAQECHHNLERKHHLQASFAPSLVYGGVTWMWWVAFVLVLWILAERWPTVLRPSVKMALAHLGAACALALAHLSLVQYSISLASSHWPSWGSLYSTYLVMDTEHFGINIVIYGLICGGCAFLYSRMQTQQAVFQKLEVERQLVQAHLERLQMQMEPHFLFNTLNAVTGLVALGRNQEAMTTLGHLNTILRRTLQRRAPEKVPFKEELQVVESYLAIQQVRLAKRLKVEMDVAPEALTGLVPCFLLQPIVENAIQHGISPMEMGGTVETLVRRNGDTLWMRVRDNGMGESGGNSGGHGIGIQNIKDRLAFFYPQAHEFRAQPRQEGGFEVTIEIPFEQVLP